MRAAEFIVEGLNHPVIVVDVQPEYCGINDGDESSVCVDIIDFVAKQTGPVLMFVNAEDSGLTGDTVQGIKQYWEDTVDSINWNRFQVVDKGYGWFRAWMDQGIDPKFIIQLIRYMYQRRLNDIRDDLEGVYQYMTNNPIGGQIVDWQDWMENETFIINWTSVSQLKRFNGAYLVGGGRNECLREVEILMNAFNIRYKRIDSLVY